MSERRSLEQKRAQRAWENVRSVKGKDFAKEYGKLARSAPADIQANGLGQTLAFWQAKGKDKAEHKTLFQHVSDWVIQQIKVDSSKNLLEWIVDQANTDEYRRATSEAIAFLIWLKRFAEAELPD